MFHDSLVDGQIAALVQKERMARDWSLSDLAERSGVSKAMISRIERAEAKPTASLLVKIATAFELTLARFFARIEQSEDRLMRREDQTVWVDPESGYTRRQLLTVADHSIELTSVHLPPGATLQFAASSYVLIEQAIWVQEGSLKVIEGENQQELREGDCLAFGPPSDVTLTNRGGKACQYLVVTSRR